MVKLMLTLQNIGGETLTQEQFRMVIGSQHIMDENTAKNLMNKASESRKLEQRARAKLLHIKGNEQRIRVIEVELHYSSLNAGDVVTAISHVSPSNVNTEDHIELAFNITMDGLPCRFTSVDFFDATGALSPPGGRTA